MTRDEFQAQLTTILDNHDKAFEAIRTADYAALESVQAIERAVAAHGVAVDVALKANRAALALLRQWDDDSQDSIRGEKG
jgi:hypothetical protein